MLLKGRTPFTTLFLRANFIFLFELKIKFSLWKRIQVSNRRDMRSQLPTFSKKLGTYYRSCFTIVFICNFFFFLFNENFFWKKWCRITQKQHVNKRKSLLLLRLKKMEKIFFLLLRLKKIEKFFGVDQQKRRNKSFQESFW